MGEHLMVRPSRLATSFRCARPDEADAVLELVVRSMGHWEHPPGYLEEAAFTTP